MINSKITAAAATLVALPFVASAAVLDNLSTLQRVQDAPEAVFPATSTITTPYGSRAMDIDGDPEPDPASTAVVILSSGARTAGIPNDLSYSNASNFKSVANLTWNFTSPLDLSGGAGGFFSLGFKGTDLPFYLTLTATGGGSSASQERLLTADDAGTLAFDFGSFAGIDLGSISSLSLNFDSIRTVAGVDADFDNFGYEIAPIPVPAAGLLLLGGLGALGAMSRRRKA